MGAQSLNRSTAREVPLHVSWSKIKPQEEEKQHSLINNQLKLLGLAVTMKLIQIVNLDNFQIVKKQK